MSIVLAILIVLMTLRRSELVMFIILPILKVPMTLLGGHSNVNCIRYFNRTDVITTRLKCVAFINYTDNITRWR